MVLLYSFAVSVLTIAGLILHLAMELSLHWNPQFYLNPIPFHLTFASAYILGINGNFLKKNVYLYSKGLNFEFNSQYFKGSSRRSPLM